MKIKTENWEDFYQTGKTGWDRGESSNNLSYWLKNDFLTPCRVLVPGCGNGYEVLKLAELGFDVVAVDIAPTPIENLKKALNENNLQAELVQADFFEWNPKEKFDVIFEQTSLCALPPELWKQYENQLSSWLKPEGKVLAAFMQTGQEGGPPYHCELSDMNVLFPKERWTWSKEHISLDMAQNKTERLYILEKI